MSPVEDPYRGLVAMGRRVPAGVGVIGASALAGLAVFGYFAIADEALPEASPAATQFAVFYTLSLLIGFGAFQPVESELARTLGRRDDPLVALREMAVVAAGIALVVAAVVAVAGVLLLGPRGYSGWLVTATAGIAAVSALEFWVRGGLLGLGRPLAFAATIAVDSLMRVALAGVVLAAAGGVGAFSLTLLVPLLLAHLAFVPAVLRWARAQDRARRAGTPAGRPRGAAGTRGVAGTPVGGRRALARRISPLFAATLSAQVLQSAPVLVVAELAPERAPAFLFAFTLARVPLFMAVPVQGALVPPMAAMVAAGRLDRLARLLGAVAVVVAAIAVLGAAAAVWLGPDVLTALFPRRASVPGLELALMVVGVAAHVGLVITAQAVLAAGSHRGAALAWLGGLAVAALAFAVGPMLGVGTASVRVEVAFAAGSAAGWALAMVLLVRLARGGHPGSHHHAEEAAVVR